MINYIPQAGQFEVIEAWDAYKHYSENVIIIHAGMNILASCSRDHGFESRLEHGKPDVFMGFLSSFGDCWSSTSKQAESFENYCSQQL